MDTSASMPVYPEVVKIVVMHGPQREGARRLTTIFTTARSADDTSGADGDDLCARCLQAVRPGRGGEASLVAPDRSPPVIAVD
jgi:hypothetical protein